ncbi:topology modulation protein [Sphaerisporangium sp. NPDC051011]|uniref:topology modulation protein n=1 Tax=Sphaerisporangium sp. NPDC051011 TaxID=3155792 RepID=UPI0033DD5216
MRKVAVIGCGGSGKTTLGRRLGSILDAPVTHLDVVYYDDDWNTLSKEKFAAVQEELVSAPAWVIDGNFASTLPIRLKAADTVIFLDLSPLTCLLGIAQRRIRHGGGQHDAIGVYDRITWEFIKYVWNYRRTMAPRVRKLIDEHARHADVHVVRSRAEANRLLDRIAATHRAT